MDGAPCSDCASEESSPLVPRISIGLCALEAKVRRCARALGLLCLRLPRNAARAFVQVTSRRFQEILGRFLEYENGLFEIVIFGCVPRLNSVTIASARVPVPRSSRRWSLWLCSDACILEKPALEWPVCECIISAYSPGFPISKAEEYVKLRRPFCVNNVSAEHVLRDRRLFYHVLGRHGIPVPRHAFMIRAGPVEKHSVIEEHEDCVIVDGVQISKPFVEKPVDADVSFGCVPLALLVPVADGMDLMAVAVGRPRCADESARS